jgi:teichuronic acid exporter
MSLKHQAISGMLWTLIQQFSTQGIAFGISVILARLLLPAEFGLIGMLSIFMGIGGILMNAGLGTSLIRSVDVTDLDYTTVFYFNLVGSFVIYALIFFVAPFIAQFYNQPILEEIVKWYCLIFIINAFSSIQHTRLNKLMLFKKELMVTVPSLILSGLVGVLMAYNGFGVWSLVFSSLVQSSAMALQLWFYSDWKPTWDFDKALFKKHFNYGYKLTLSGVLETFFVNVYSIIIGKFFDPTQIGFYNRADSLKQLPVSNISSVLNKVTFTLFAKIQNDDVRLKDAFKRIMLIVLFIVAPVLLIMAALGEPLFRFIFTEKWLPAVPYFQILCWNGILYPIHAYNLNILNVKGRSDLFLKLEILKKILVVLVIVISFKFGIYGLLFGSVITSISAFFINSHYSGKFINYSALQQIKDLTPTLFIAVICSGLVFVSDFMLKDFIVYDVFRLIFGGIIGSLTYLLMAHLFKMTAFLELIKIIKKQ